MSRTQKILGGTLIAQAVILVTMNLSALTGAAATREARALLPVLDSVTPAKIYIASGADESLVLEHKSEGWVLPDSGDYPVPTEKITDLISSLKGLEVRRPVVSNSRYHEALKVTDDEYERRVQVWADAAGDADVDLLVGTSPNYRITHVREAGSDDVYEAMAFGASELRADAGSWIDKKFIDVPFDEITAVEVSNAGGTFGLQKQGGTWSIVSSANATSTALDSSKVDTFVRALATMWMLDPVGAVDEVAHGLATPAARVALTRTPAPPPVEGAEGDAAAAGPVEQPQAEVIEYRIGGQKDEESGHRYVARNGFGYTVTVSKYDAEKSVDKKLEDLLVDAATDAAVTDSGS